MWIDEILSLQQFILFLVFLLSSELDYVKSEISPYPSI